MDTAAATPGKPRRGSLSSPEGTVTTLVQDRQVLVYAPRAARAQKVIFDTPDRQLIYEPDTPFRTFFDGHSPDFADGKVDYAKATILKDVVNMLRNKEYVRLLVREVVERHLASAITSNAPCGTVRVGSKQLSLMEAGRVIMEKRQEDKDLLEWVQPDLLQPTQLEFSFVREVDRVAPSLTKPVRQWIQDPNVAGQDAVWTRLEDQLQALCEKGAADDGGWRARHARLLVDAISLELVNEQYPEMRDEDIDALFQRFTRTEDSQVAGAGSGTLGQIWRFTTMDGQSLEANEALVVDLRHTLSERQFFRVIIDRAVTKRANLFRSGDSAVAGLERFKSELATILKSNLEAGGLLTNLATRVSSPWAAFLETLNSADPSTRLLCADHRLDAGDRPLAPRELAVLGKDLRSALITNLLLTGPQPRLEGAVGVLARFFSETIHSNSLRPNFGTTKSISALLQEQRELWTRSLTSQVPLMDEHGKWTAAVTKDPKVAAEIAATSAELKKALTNALERYQTTIPQEKRISLDAFRGRIESVVPTNQSLALPVMVENLLKVDFELELHSARTELANRLATVFQAYPRWILSDAPLFATILQDVRFPFTDPAYRSRVVAELPKLYADLIKTAAVPATAEAAMEKISGLCDVPAVSYLFGSPANNASVIEAFKEEFYNAFKHRLSEALTAEREVDYDYWWITFYPKAIPMGYRKLEGDSFIEVAFPTAAVPEEQFHRWLEDRRLDPEVPRKDACRGRGEGALELATSVVRDFQTVLETPWFAQHFVRLRPQLTQALQLLERKDGLPSCEVLDRALRSMLETAEYRPSQAAAVPSAGTCRCDRFKVPAKTVAFETRDGFSAFMTNAYSRIFSPNVSPKEGLANEDCLRDALAMEPLSLKHVVFAVASAAVHQAPLPEKVNLYSYTYLDYTRTNDARLGLLDIPRNPEGLSILDSKTYMDRFRAIFVNSYYSAYPDVPGRDVIQGAFLEDPEMLSTLVFRWLMESVNYRLPVSLRRVYVTKVLDAYPFFTPDVRKRLIEAIVGQWADGATTKAELDARRLSAFRTIMGDLRMVDQIAGGLVDAYYVDLFRSMNAMAEVGRHPVPFDRITAENYQNFRRWGKLRNQEGIQIVEMLPASRDDLVSMAISEGGVVAKAAAQAEGAAAYDVNKMQMAMRTFDTLRSQSSKVTDPKDAAASALAEFGGSTQKKEQYSALRQGGDLGGYSLGAAANGSVYARARAAMAYSRRREYLNAAITAAGRGDNFAKWVVRKSDLRSGFATPSSSRRLTAAAHTGFPNGDQPFHLLVKVPRSATFTDWSGKRHILFNSAYAATRKTSLWKMAGGIGLIAKTPFALINPHWWSSIEEDMVATCFPFKWDVKCSTEQAELMATPNVLAGTIWLDEMDKIRHSEVVAMLEAEDNFIRQTREAQSREIGIALENLEQETKSFRTNVVQNLNSAIASQIRAMTNAASRSLGPDSPTTPATPATNP